MTITHASFISFIRDIGGQFIEFYPDSCIINISIIAPNDKRYSKTITIADPSQCKTPEDYEQFTEAIIERLFAAKLDIIEKVYNNLSDLYDISYWGTTHTRGTLDALNDLHARTPLSTVSCFHRMMSKGFTLLGMFQFYQHAKRAINDALQIGEQRSKECVAIDMFIKDALEIYKSDTPIKNTFYISEDKESTKSTKE